MTCQQRFAALKDQRITAPEKTSELIDQSSGGFPGDLAAAGMAFFVKAVSAVDITVTGYRLYHNIHELRNAFNRSVALTGLPLQS